MQIIYRRICVEAAQMIAQNDFLLRKISYSKILSYLCSRKARKGLCADP